MKKLLTDSNGCLQSKSSSPVSDDSGISLTASKNGGLCGEASGLTGIGSSADVGEGVADTVGDDVWVQGLLLDCGDLSVVGLESELGLRTSSKTADELDGWVAGTEWRGSTGISTGVATSVVITSSGWGLSGRCLNDRCDSCSLE